MSKTPTPDYQLEFVYKKSKFRRAMWTYLAIWLVLRILRVILYLTVGITYLAGFPVVLITWASGVVFGFAILSIYVYRRSLKVEEIDREVERITNKH